MINIEKKRGCMENDIQKTKKVLFIDSSREWCETIRILLSKSIYDVVTFEDLPDGQNYWKDNSEDLDLVICVPDVHEEEDGIDFLTDISDIGLKVLVFGEDCYDLPSYSKTSVSKEALLAKMDAAIAA